MTVHSLSESSGSAGPVSHSPLFCMQWYRKPRETLTFVSNLVSISFLHTFSFSTKIRYQILHLGLLFFEGKWVLVSQSWLTLCDPIDCCPPDSSVHGILQARILEWVAIPLSRESSRPRGWTWVSCIARRFFTIWVTKEAPLILSQHSVSLSLECSIFLEHTHGLLWRNYDTCLMRSHTLLQLGVALRTLHCGSISVVQLLLFDGTYTDLWWFIGCCFLSTWVWMFYVKWGSR